MLRGVFFRGLLASAVAGGIAGCSMHPLPENVSRASTFDIVERVRCEVQEALRDFRSDDRHARRIIDATTIGYDFEFIITEGNSIGDRAADATGGDLELKRPAFLDSAKKGFTLEVDAGAEKERKNTRRFRVVEELKEVREAKCWGVGAHANWVHPITGSTGMHEVVRTYVKLEKLSDIKPVVKLSEDVQGVLPGRSIVFSDVLKFTTTLTGGAKGTLVLNAVAGSLKITNAQLGGSAVRKDEHNVIVALATDPKVDVDRDEDDELAKLSHAVSRKMAIARAERKKILERDVLLDPRTVNVLVQKDVSARNRVLLELERLRDVEDNERDAATRLGRRLLDILKVP